MLLTNLFELTLAFIAPDWVTRLLDWKPLGCPPVILIGPFLNEFNMFLEEVVFAPFIPSNCLDMLIELFNVDPLEFTKAPLPRKR